MNLRCNHIHKLCSLGYFPICLTIAIGISASTYGSVIQSQRSVSKVNEYGIWTQVQMGYGLSTSKKLLQGGQIPGVIWQAVDPISITNSVCVSDTTNETWVGHNLNSERLAYHETTGDGNAIFNYDLPTNPSMVAVASAENISLGVVFEQHPTGGSTVTAFNEANGNVPIWTYEFAANYNFNNIRNIDVSADGEVVIAAARDTNAGISLVVILDGATGEELDTLIVDAGVAGVELSDSGTRAVLTEGATVRIIDTFTMNTLFTFAVSGAGGYQRISRDGTTVAGGGFNCLVYKEIGGDWIQIYSLTQASNWLGNGLALSANGDTLFLASYNYATGYLTLTYRVIDLVNNVELAQITTQGSGSQQDTVQQAQASADGEIFSVISWGTQDNAHPEVQIFDRDLNLIGEIDTPGSPFGLDMSSDGQFVVVGSKSVHANTSGNGSNTYAYQVFAACVGDLDGNGSVGTTDLLDLLSQWGTSGTADFDGSGDVGTADLLILLANWGPC